MEGYLSKALDSIISQSFGFENIEVIMVDDKSTDSTPEIMAEYADAFDNVRAIYLDEGSGFPGKPRNVGLENAAAPYVMFLDPDDWLSQDSCRVLYETIVGEDADIVGGSYTFVKDGVRQINRKEWITILTPPDMDENQRQRQAYEMFDDPNFRYVITDLEKNGHVLSCSNVWGKIYKKSMISENGIEFPEDIVAQDSVFLLESLYNAGKIVFINDITAHYNNRKGKSVSKTKSISNLYGRIRAYDLMNDISINHSMEALFCRYLLNRKLNYWFERYLMKTDIPASEIEEIFEKYSYLFSGAYETGLNMSSKAKAVFKKIHEEDYAGAAETVVKSKESKGKSEKSDEESFLRKFRMKIFK